MSGPRKPDAVEVIGHRGACALRPEHTLGAYAQAIAAGADYVEPDLVISRDGVLIVRHENEISETTDVRRHPEFAARRATKLIDGRALTGWFTEDFTLAELKTLRAIERLPQVRPQNTAYDGQFEVLAFDEFIAFVAAEAARSGRLIGMAPEIKHSTYFASLGLPMEVRVVSALQAQDYARGAPVIIQSFEVANLRYLREALGRPANVRLMQLLGAPEVRPADVAATRGDLTYARMTSLDGLREVARYADIVAPSSRQIIPLGDDGRLGVPTGLVDEAHAAALQVHAWTFRPENRYLAGDFQDEGEPDSRNPEGSVAEITRYLRAGLDGFFTDDPALGRRATRASRAPPQPRPFA